MKSLLHLLTLLTATSAMVLTRQDEPEGNSTRELKNCPEPDEAFLKLTDEFAKEEGNEENITARADVTINTWVHVVATSRNVEDGWVSDESIKKQMNVINNAYKGRNFQFKLAGTTRTVDQDLAVVKPGEKTAKLGKKLRKGGYDTLNLYIVKDMPDNVAGDCTLPSANPPQNLDFDGCRFNWDTLPSRSNGKVLIHEIGHWLGLLHTFQEGNNPTCNSGHGDQIKDTPIHLRPTGTECRPVDTCPNKPGSDPIHNYMNYTPTTCWTHFTDGQGKRMHNMWKLRTRN